MKKKKKKKKKSQEAEEDAPEHRIVEMLGDGLGIRVVGILNVGTSHRLLLLPVLVEFGDVGVTEGSGRHEQEGEEEESGAGLHCELFFFFPP